MDTFGEWIRLQRNQLRLTREQFANRVGCSVALLRKIEDGERRPSVQIAELMANCLDIPPAERSTFVRVARGELSVDRLPSVLKPITVSAHPQINLPVLPTPLIGRQREVEELGQLLRDPQCRLLTLVGPGGIGKTRLAIETASQLQDIFADGVYFVPLAPVNTTRFIVPVIAEAIGFTFQSARSADPKAQLFSYLKEKQVLLLTDNLEHLLAEPGIELLAELLANASQVKLLATSRELLGLQGEWLYDVQGLPVPERQFVQESAQNTSVELFLQRARRAYVGFSATTVDFSAIVRICQLVEGMPLAIELAAAWVRTLSCNEIAQEIERGLDFLSLSARDLPARHHSINAVFDHSWKLLSEQEQAILCRLSVFRGGFRREAAEAVADATINVLSNLVAKSLIRHNADNRYDLHELIRQYTTSKLATDAIAQRAAQRHSNYYLDWLGQCAIQLKGHGQKSALTELTTEVHNIRAAWDWAITHHDIARTCQVSTGLWYLFELRTWFAEGETIFHNAAETIQSLATEIEPDDDTLTAVNAMQAHSAYFSSRLGNSTAAFTVLLPSALYLQSSKDQLAGIYALWYLGIVCWELGKFEEANKCLLQSLEKARAYGDQWYESLACQFIGIIAQDKGEHDLAHQYLTEALASARETGDPTIIAHALSFLSLTLLALGKTTEAEKSLQESLALMQEIGYRWGIGNALDGLALLAQVTSPEKARTLFAASNQVFREIDDLRSLSRVLIHQGYNLITLDDAAEAQDSFITVLRLARDSGYIPYVLDALVGLALLHASRGERAHALELLIISLNHPAIVQGNKDRAVRLRIELEAQLSNQQIKAAQARAEVKTLEAAVDEVLRQV